MSSYTLDHLDQLEAEAIHIIREAAATAQHPVLLYSIGKDSSVLLELIRRAFLPGKIPFPVMQIETGFQFTEMIEFRDYYTQKIGVDLIVQRNTEPAAEALGPDDTHTEEFIYLKKTKPLLDGLLQHKFDCAFGGARRDEEKSRAKERIVSIRDAFGVWDPKNQRPELWHAYNTLLAPGQTMRVFPISNWTEADIWGYILRENIEIVPLYFAKKQPAVRRNGMILRVDEYVQPKDDEVVEEIWCRYRTLGCAPSTGAVESQAQSIEEIYEEVLHAETSERGNRAIDKNSDDAMERKKREGYF